MDLNSILNTDGNAARAAPAPGHAGRSMSISGEQFAHPPPRMHPVRAYSSIGDLSPESQRSILQSHPPPLIRTSPELQRDFLHSQTPTTAHSSPDFQRDILNPQIPSAGHSSPSDRAIRKSSTPAPLPPPEFRERPTQVLGPPPAPSEHDMQQQDMRTSQKRKADTAFDPDHQSFRPDRPSISTVASVDSMQNNSVGAKLSVTPDGMPTPIIKKEPGFPNITPEQPKKKRKYLEVPIWAQRKAQGSRRFVGPNGLQIQPLANGHGQRPISRGSTPSGVPDRASPRSEPPPGGLRLEPNMSIHHAFYETRRGVMTFLQQFVVVHGDPVNLPDSAGVTRFARARWEIEAKLGKIINRHSNQRLDLGIQTETVLRQGAHDVRFESGVTPQQYQHLNQYLNNLTRLSQGKGRVPITYKHPRETDTFAELSQHGLLALPGIASHHINHNHKKKMRTTTDAKTGQITANIVKARVADLDILRPDNDLDIRISVNIEVEFAGPIDDFINPSMSPRSQRDNSAREKDRLSYSHQATQIDLTKVTMSDANPPTVLHEVEVELDNGQLLAEGGRCLAGMQNLYEEVVGQFVENAIVLVRAADDTTIQRFCL